MFTCLCVLVCTSLFNCKCMYICEVSKGTVHFTASTQRCVPFPPLCVASGTTHPWSPNTPACGWWPTASSGLWGKSAGGSSPWRSAANTSRYSSRRLCAAAYEHHANVLTHANTLAHHSQIAALSLPADLLSFQFLYVSSIYAHTIC